MHPNDTDYERDTATAPLLQREKAIPTPLPKLQLFTLCFARLVDPIAMTQIFPYINQMIEDLHVTDDPSRVGFYSGVVDSIFSLAQLLAIYHSGRLSDKIGRKPVIFVGLAGVAISTLLFGLARTFTMVIITRVIAGALSGNIAVIHSVLGEITDESNQAFAFPIYGLCYPLGAIIGPILGGSLSRPATRFTWLDIPFLRTYPYFLPCFVATVTTLVAIAFGLYFLEETLPGKRKVKTTTIHPSTTSPAQVSYGTAPASATTNEISNTVAGSNSDKDAGAEQCATASSLLAIPQIRSLAASGFVLSFCGMAFDVVFVLFCFTPIEMGGLAFDPTEIGYALALAGTLSASIQLFITPIILGRFKVEKLYDFTNSIWPLLFVLLPFLNILARIGSVERAVDGGVKGIEGVERMVGMFVEAAQMQTLGGGAAVEGALTMRAEWRAVIWVGVGIILALSRFACLAFSFSMILVRNAAPSPASLGTANGLIQSVMCLARAIAPAFVSSLFAVSVGQRILGGNMIWIAMFILSLLALHCTRNPTEEDGESD
ncbi:hypothetical protein BOTBODRAFT_31015 [Botryobasidium botryosum FD-172 SS1]|uniref:Major facilitator superfamily (MFS) profile domain-containing protein n=1 Tax=Botryobasidium botryosum (strain FD-172 SS1) TaxID=930990 RepID=A0A067MLC4_BOTB1|nr:hypothetical protein BOTBODRAFT_31015 [Botryobasidium botryosum FD-172 SS1]